MDDQNPAKEVSPQQLEANRKNAQRSTGPRTAQGKRKKGQVVPGFPTRLRHGAFYVASRLGTWLYRHSPLFGRLRGSIAIISRSGQYLVIERGDGHGWCFPGGLSRPGKAPKATVRREVLEETGLMVTACRLLVGFDEPITHTHVFAVEVSGEVKGSWEGKPRWLSLQNCRQTSIWRTGRFSHYCTAKLLKLCRGISSTGLARSCRKAQEFARRVGISQNYVSDVERGNVEVGAEILLRISRVFDSPFFQPAGCLPLRGSKLISNREPVALARRSSRGFWLVAPDPVRIEVEVLGVSVRDYAEAVRVRGGAFFVYEQLQMSVAPASPATYASPTQH
jgi:8-oxo-dGTP pyrophosphatase MutT (NUDIX family)/transcriptional regulator with XRE-family HTH domain